MGRARSSAGPRGTRPELRGTQGEPLGPGNRGTPHRTARRRRAPRGRLGAWRYRPRRGLLPPTGAEGTRAGRRPFPAPCGLRAAIVTGEQGLYRTPGTAAAALSPRSAGAAARAVAFPLLPASKMASDIRVPGYPRNQDGARRGFTYTRFRPLERAAAKLCAGAE